MTETLLVNYTGGHFDFGHVKYDSHDIIKIDSREFRVMKDVKTRNKQILEIKKLIFVNDVCVEQVGHYSILIFRYKLDLYLT